jgi:hypothetical protein
MGPGMGHEDGDKAKRRQVPAAIGKAKPVPKRVRLRDGLWISMTW